MKLLPISLFSLAVMLSLPVFAGGPTDAPDTTAAEFQLGVTHERHSADWWGDEEAVADAKRILSSVGPLQNQHLMGFGAVNPWPEQHSDERDWQSLDERIELIEETGGTPVITLCCAPGWMTPGGEDWPDKYEAPQPQFYGDYAQLAAEAAQRYPQVTYFQVWNEFKGFWNNEANRWDYEGYTELYNKVYAAVKEVRPDAELGGPYLSLNTYTYCTHDCSDLEGSWGTVDQRDLNAMEYWLANAVGGEFFTVDTWSSTNDGYHPTQVETYQKFQAITQWITDRTELPVWWSEFYAPERAGSEASTVGLLRAAIEGMRDGGAAVALLWGPECQSELPCIWTATDQAGGGHPTEYLPLVQEFSTHQ
ncbi:xylan 1,4-beta-xylosidase [Microbulbifer rhizosphaerae]|uniref:Glycosyl hydrolases family 39 n=1 Tax=Microbulbifer rhizosphaerae TaxID=1562603 RepID=A0A7W4WDX2_9GAMM|nr:xylan 1,4-beta-xylosidase [Microbulbifer rhizosphaerae]MBB3061761.1 hypothetical protein [Microbulbifer rhizosphaerae]